MTALEHADVVQTLSGTFGEVILRLSPSPKRPRSGVPASPDDDESNDVLADIPPPAEPGSGNYFQSSSPVSAASTYMVDANVNVAVPPSPGFVVSTGQFDTRTNPENLLALMGCFAPLRKADERKVGRSTPSVTSRGGSLYLLLLTCALLINASHRLLKALAVGQAPKQCR